MKAALVALALLAASALAGPAAPPRELRHVSAPAVFEDAEVWLFGDSITYLSASRLEPIVEAQDGTPLAWDGYYGAAAWRQTDHLLDRLRTTRNRPTVVVFALGTNDALVGPDLEPLRGRDPEDVVTQLRRVRQAVPSARLVWVDLYLRRTAQDLRVVSAELETCRRVNAAVRASGLASAYVPWFDTMLGPDGDETLLSDGVHPTSQGAELRSALVAAAVAPLLRPGALAWSTRRRSSPSPSLVSRWSDKRPQAPGAAGGCRTSPVARVESRSARDGVRSRRRPIVNA